MVDSPFTLNSGQRNKFAKTISVVNYNIDWIVIYPMLSIALCTV